MAPAVQLPCWTTSTPLIPAEAGTQVPERKANEHDLREADVWEALAAVLDPELDESVVDLGFVARLAVIGDSVEADFRLPTFWCSANFAWIMAEDMRAALDRLPWLKHADVRLVDHFAAGKVNEGVAAGQGFREAFGGEAAADLASLREAFRTKAYLGRMSRLIEALRACGWSDIRIASATLGDLGEARANPEIARLVDRYRELRTVYGGPADPTESAFRTAEGDPIGADGLAAFLRDIRMTRRGVEANGEMCRAMLKARIEAPVPAEPDFR
jgi:metal-sulfur cluster biosynthetic enzyme